MMRSGIDRRDLLGTLLPGTVIWRRCHVYHGGVTPYEYTDDELRPSRGGSLICRTMLAGIGDFLPEPVVAPADPPGIVTFVSAPPPDDWTHLVIRNHSREGNALFAEWNGSLPMDVYLRFRERYYRDLARLQGAPAPVQLEVAKDTYIRLLKDQHRGFYCRSADNTWSVECPLQVRRPVIAGE